MTLEVQAPKTVDPDGQNRYEWHAHPATTHPVRAAGAMIVIGLLMSVVYRITGEMIYAAIVLGVFLVSLAPFFQRSMFVISDSGVTRRILGRSRILTWNEIRQVVPSRRGVYLSPLPRASWLDHRGIYLLFGDHKEEVLARLKKRIDKAETASGCSV